MSKTQDECSPVSDSYPLSSDDRQRIAYILEQLQEYIDDVGPRDLRDFKDEIPELITRLWPASVDG